MHTNVDIGASAKLELVDKFCYLDNIYLDNIQLWSPEFELVGISSGSW